MQMKEICLTLFFNYNGL